MKAVLRSGKNKVWLFAECSDPYKEPPKRSPCSPDLSRLAPLALDRTRLARIIPVPAFSGEKVLSNDYPDQSDQLSGDLPTLTVLP